MLSRSVLPLIHFGSGTGLLASGFCCWWEHLRWIPREEGQRGAGSGLHCELCAKEQENQQHAYTIQLK